MSSKSLSTHSPVLCSNHTILTLYDRIRSLPDEILFTIFLYLPREYIPQQLWDTKYFKDKWVLCHVRIIRIREECHAHSIYVKVDDRDWFVSRPEYTSEGCCGVCDKDQIVYTPGADSLVIKQEAENILKHVPFSNIQEDVTEYWRSILKDKTRQKITDKEMGRVMWLKERELEEKEMEKMKELICSQRSVYKFHYNYYYVNHIRLKIGRIDEYGYDLNLWEGRTRTRKFVEIDDGINHDTYYYVNNDDDDYSSSSSNDEEDNYDDEEDNYDYDGYDV